MAEILELLMYICITSFYRTAGSGDILGITDACVILLLLAGSVVYW